MSACGVVTQHPIDKPVQKITLLGRQTGEEATARGKAVLLQSVRPTPSGRRDFHQHLTTDATASMQQTVGFQPIDEPDGGRMGEADDGGHLANAGRRVVGSCDQGGDGRRRESGIPGERRIGDGLRQGSELVRQVFLHGFPHLSGIRPDLTKGSSRHRKFNHFSLINEGGLGYRSEKTLIAFKI